MVLLLCTTCDSYAQVRVKRARNRFADDRPRKIHPRNPERDKPRKKRQKDATTYVNAAIPDPHSSLDDIFYVKWKPARKLTYDDFVSNKNLYNKFLPARDSDLAKVIYPDYRDFYKKLNDRQNPDLKSEDSLQWQARAERLLREKKEIRSEYMFSTTSIDSAGMFPITIDSPAASVVVLSPVIYPLGEDRYYYNITALFSKHDSWMIVRSKDILDHEQIHFDIYEIFARKMRRHVIETIRRNYNAGTMANVADEIAPVFEQLYQQLTDLHLEFDRQTAALTGANSTLVPTNAIWKRAMQQQLAELEKYAIPEATIRLE
ncbi:hypothetical protein GCM10023093_27200 [Nemorincola caseinilytica]|uniref:Uncharacterized protein n=1 Tax=Nemorincola caseinilytica TaxID=2054315 RepID=A0ABP8NLC0_9BACT